MSNEQPRTRSIPCMTGQVREDGRHVVHLSLKTVEREPTDKCSDAAVEPKQKT